MGAPIAVRLDDEVRLELEAQAFYEDWGTPTANLG